MNILFLSVSYNEYQENIYTDLVKELVKNNHHVTIVTSNSTTNKIINNNLRIVGFLNRKNYSENLITKGLSILFASNHFISEIKSNLKDENFDLILYATPPITLNRVVKYCKRKYSAKSYLMLKDIFPQNAVDLEMFSRNNPIYYYFRFQEKSLYNISDRIGCMSKGNVEYLLKHNSNIDAEKVEIFPNSIDIKEYDKSVSNDMKETVFLLGGNLGRPQNIPLLLSTMKKLENYNLARFIIVGKGTETSKIQKYLKEGNKNLQYVSFLERDKYEQILMNVDVGIISLDPRFTIPNIPSKMPTYMNFKKPILAITDTATDLKSIIIDADCGWWINAQDEEGIIKCIKEICENKEQHAIKGENGFKYLKKYFDVKESIKQLESFMEEKVK